MRGLRRLQKVVNRVSRRFRTNNVLLDAQASDSLDCARKAYKSTETLNMRSFSCIRLCEVYKITFFYLLFHILTNGSQETSYVRKRTERQQKYSLFNF